MTDFRKADISKQESYDLLRDWIKLVARHTNPDQDISELLGWLWKLKPATPDPTTGLVPCGCGGKAHLWPDGRESRTYHVVCCECRASAHYFANEQEAKDAWNRAMRVKGADE